MNLKDIEANGRAMAEIAARLNALQNQRARLARETVETDAKIAQETEQLRAVLARAGLPSGGVPIAPAVPATDLAPGAGEVTRSELAKAVLDHLAKVGEARSVDQLREVFPMTNTTTLRCVLRRLTGRTPGVRRVHRGLYQAVSEGSSR